MFWKTAETLWGEGGLKFEENNVLKKQPLREEGGLKIWRKKILEKTIKSTP